MKIYKELFNKIVEPENLFSAWEHFRIGKGKKSDVLDFEKDLEPNIFKLHRDLQNGRYRHGSYFDFFIHDPKRRHIYKSTVRDRVLHHAVFQILDPIYEPVFIATSCSCRIGKGNHRGVIIVERMLRKESLNYSRECYALKCDVQKFFDSVDHRILLAILERKIRDPGTILLLKEIIESYDENGGVTVEREREREREPSLFSRKGIPIGNLTSQLFANVYMNEFDQFMKHELKVKNYVRYTDDFVIISESIDYLKSLLPRIEKFLGQTLRLKLHPEKVFIRKSHQGIDFLGYVIFPHHKLLRARTRKRMDRKLRNRVRDHKAGLVSKESLEQTFQSYLGILSHANAYRLSQDLKNKYWLML